MKKKPLKERVPADRATAAVPPPRDLVQARTRELAQLAGRTTPQVVQGDYEQAKRDVTGETNPDRQDAILDALPEEKRWDPVPGSPGRQAPESPSEGEDDEGRGETEQLVDEGVAAAERDQLLQAAKAARKE